MCRGMKTIAVAVALNLMLISASSWSGSSPAVAQPPGCCEPGPPTPTQQQFINDMRSLGVTSSDLDLRGAANSLCFITWGRPDLANTADTRRIIRPVDWETARSLAQRDYCPDRASIGL